MGAFMTWGLPVLQSLVATGISQVAMADLYSDDGSENDAFRKIMREAFTDAVKKVRKDANDISQTNTIKNEFKYYQKVLIEELIKLEPIDRKKYIEQDLYLAFKSEVMKRQDALQNISLKLAQFAMQNQQQYVNVINDMRQLIVETNQKLDDIIADSLKKASYSGLCPSSILESKEDIAIWIPPLRAERKEIISELARRICENKSLLLYAGIKEGKTVTAALLSQSLKDYKIIWLDFGLENRLNLEVVIQQYRKEEQILFVLDNIKYDDDKLYEKLIHIVQVNKSDRWLFLINAYEKFSDILFSSNVLSYEYALPPLSEEEVGEMIPEDKKPTYLGLIHTLFEGQPLLTHMACVYLQENGWGTSAEDIGNLFRFPKGTTTEKKVKRMARQMLKDDDYALLNRLLLLDKSFSVDDCLDLANVNPVIRNPQQKLESLCGTWINEKEGIYKLSPLLRKTMGVDMLPQELRDCCGLIARKIIHQPGGITPNDAFRALNMLITSKSGDDAAAFYVLMLLKLDELNLLDHESSMLWKAIWVDVELPDWMTVENKMLIRNVQLLVLVMKHKLEAESIINDLEHQIELTDNKSDIKAACVRVLVCYFLLNNKTEKLPKYKQLSAQLPHVPDTDDSFDEEKFIFVALDNVKTVDDLFSWAQSYKNAGSPNIELIPDGVIMKINQICDNTEDGKRIDTLAWITGVAVDAGFEIVSIVACARWIDLLSEKKNVKAAKEVMSQYGFDLAETKLGCLLVNYSYGLCLNNNGLGEEGYAYIEKACVTNDMAMASAVLLNACVSLAELRAKKDDKPGAVEILIKIVNHKDFGYCYTDYEKGAAFGSLSYAYWMVGEKEEATKELLKVEGIIWDHREKRDDDFKNLSMRFCVLALFMASEISGKSIDDEHAKPDYSMFVKIAPTLLEGYKPERNFTVLFAVYHLAEMVLQDEQVSIDIIEHMFEMQRSDATKMASLLSALMQAYPLFVLNNREDMLEYVVLTSLAGANESKDKEPVSFESFVLVNAIASMMMKRTILMAEGGDVDDDSLFEMIEKAFLVMPQHDLTDRIAIQMRNAEPDFSALKEFHEWGVVATYHINSITPAMGLSALYIMVKTLLEPNMIPTAIKLADRFIKSFAYLLVKNNENRFNMELREFERFFKKVEQKHGMDFLRSVMQGLYYKLKTEPILDKDILNFIEL